MTDAPIRKKAVEPTLIFERSFFPKDGRLKTVYVFNAAKLKISLYKKGEEYFVFCMEGGGFLVNAYEDYLLALMFYQNLQANIEALGWETAEEPMEKHIVWENIMFHKENKSTLVFGVVSHYTGCLIKPLFERN